MYEKASLLYLVIVFICTLDIIWTQKEAICEDTSSEANGFFTSPNYPEDYGHVFCEYFIEVNALSKITITFAELDLEIQGHVAYDYLYYGVGLRTDRVDGGMFIGSRKPEPFAMETDSGLWFLLQTDESNFRDFRGFSFSWETESGCGYSTSHTSGALPSPNFPQDYPGYLDCTYTIIPTTTTTDGPDWMIVLTFKYIELEEDYDFLYIGNGSDTDPANVLQEYTGDFSPPLVVTVFGGGPVWVKITSDVNNGQGGFYLSWISKPITSGPGDGPTAGNGDPSTSDRTTVSTSTIITDSTSSQNGEKPDKQQQEGDSSCAGAVTVAVLEAIIIATGIICVFIYYKRRDMILTLLNTRRGVKSDQPTRYENHNAQDHPEYIDIYPDKSTTKTGSITLDDSNQTPHHTGNRDTEASRIEKTVTDVGTYSNEDPVEYADSTLTIPKPISEDKKTGVDDALAVTDHKKTTKTDEEVKKGEVEEEEGWEENQLYGVTDDTEILPNEAHGEAEGWVDNDIYGQSD